MTLRSQVRTSGDQPSSSTDTTSAPATGSKRPRGRRPDGGRNFTRWDRSRQSTIAVAITFSFAFVPAIAGPATPMLGGGHRRRGPDEGAYSAASEVIKYMSLGVLPQETQAAILCLLEQRDRQRVAQASRVLKDAVQTYHLVDARAYYNDAPDHVWQDEQVLMYVRSGRALTGAHRGPARGAGLQEKTIAGYRFPYRGVPFSFRQPPPSVSCCVQ